MHSMHMKMNDRNCHETECDHMHYEILGDMLLYLQGQGMPLMTVGAADIDSIIPGSTLLSCSSILTLRTMYDLSVGGEFTIFLYFLCFVSIFFP